MSSKLKFVKLDVLKSQEPGIEKYASKISSFDGINGVSITVIEIDAKTETLQIDIEGQNINLNDVKDKIKKLGGTVHSVDKVITSKKKLKDTVFFKKSE